MVSSSQESDLQLIYPTHDDEIDPEHAKFLYEHHCAILVIENLPVGSEFGIDLFSFRVGDKFKGMKLIPPGLHFIFASSIDKDGKQFGHRCGFYHNFKAKEFLIRRWSTIEEDFDDSFEPSDELRERYTLNIMDLDRFLGSYRFSTYQTYVSLTDKLTCDLVRDLVPTNNKIRSVTYFNENSANNSESQQTRPKRRTLRTNDLRQSENNLLPNLQPAKETLIRFTKLQSSHTYELENQMSPDMITRYNLDSTLKVSHTFGFSEQGQRRLLAEFQFAFTTLILGHVYDCFEQWRNILVLICSSDSAVGEHPKLFVEFAKILRHQLEHVPEEIFEDFSDMDNLIRHHLDIFVQNVQQATVIDTELHREVVNLRRFAEEKFGWIFDLELDEERPVVVDL